eukprot:CAMPEP_0113464936 /NCGR_PEP_ID=MMETSP0014_2-20120614/13468_1 /TAXON_ID=2857 /ORGANISM="Nitzschia sp." /LENGTH=339 /DNA_ID=CAMNT_0000357053 /DNA_START=237 /DNA_END=1253 /DNA_ORIENTATION=- /assembly_acc=CAM_ASM_000159
MSFNNFQLCELTFLSKSQKSSAEEDFDWIEGYGELIKSLSRGLSFDGRDHDRFDWEDYQYDGPRYKANSESNRTVSICAVVKNEEAYIDEWWSYYKALGVSALYLYENDETPSLYQWASIQNTSSFATVHYTHYPTRDKSRPQEMAYLDCMKRALFHGHTWSANFDIDEYLMMYKHKHIVDLLDEYVVSGSVAFHWKMFDPDGWETYAPQPVTKRFRMSGWDKPRAKAIAHRFKTIARLSDVDMTRRTNAHFVRLKEGRKSHDLAGNDVTNKWNDLAHQPSEVSEVALLYHYKTKSFGEYIGKHKRGRVDKGIVDDNLVNEALTRKIDYKGTVYDDSMW